MKTLRALSLTFFIFGLLGWVYIAGSAVLRPDNLDEPLTHFLPWLRADTSGAACFVLFLLAFFVWNILRDENRRMRSLRSLSLTLAVLGFSGWVYIAGNAISHPETLSLPLTHFLDFPREDTFGAACFAISFISFFVWNLLREEK